MDFKQYESNGWNDGITGNPCNAQVYADAKGHEAVARSAYLTAYANGRRASNVPVRATYATTWDDGAHVWHYFDSEDEAAAASLPGWSIVEATPGKTWRARVAVSNQPT